jgi:acetoin utilization protein AcuB
MQVRSQVHSEEDLMSKAVPRVSKFMTAMPHTIEPSQPLSMAQKKFRELGCRHLPVRHGGEVVGLLSERDINMLATFSGVDMKTAQVKDAMATDVFKVDPDTSVDQVAVTMAENKYGSALVVQPNGTLVGIFTVVDALRALAEVFETRLK